MNYILDRIKEPSTRLGIATVLGIVAPYFPAYTALVQVIAGMIAGHAVVAPDHKP